jgi:hypothetical protein
MGDPYADDPNYECDCPCHCEWFFTLCPYDCGCRTHNNLHPHRECDTLYS